MNASKLIRKRGCDSCMKWLMLTAKQMVEHSITCKRLVAIGLVPAGGVEEK